jgi:hypothetical protein
MTATITRKDATTIDTAHLGDGPGSVARKTSGCGAGRPQKVAG